jgi:hypothetical protein
MSQRSAADEDPSAERGIVYQIERGCNILAADHSGCRQQLNLRLVHVVDVNSISDAMHQLY